MILDNESNVIAAALASAVPLYLRCHEKGACGGLNTVTGRAMNKPAPRPIPIPQQRTHASPR